MPDGLVLIVEDEPLIAMSIEECVRDLGLTPTTASRLDDALVLAREAELAGAVLDVNMQSERSGAVADVLRARGVPFVVSTGSEVERLPEAFVGAPLLTKPYPDDELCAWLERVVGTAREAT